MFKSPRWLFAFVVLAAFGAFVGWNLRSVQADAPAFHSNTDSTSSVDADSSSDTSAAPDSSDDSVVWSHGRDGSAKNAEEHWEKHGGQFPQDHTARDYEQDAQQFVQHPPPGTEIKHRDNGDTLLYNPGTNTFAVTESDGTPRTMFKPDRGASYWGRQH